MPTSGDLKSGDCLFFTSPPEFQRPSPPRKIDPAPNGNHLGHYMTSYMMYNLRPKFQEKTSNFFLSAKPYRPKMFLRSAEAGRGIAGNFRPPDPGDL